VTIVWGNEEIIKQVASQRYVFQRRDERIWIPSRENIVTGVDPDIATAVVGTGVASYTANTPEQYVLRLNAGANNASLAYAWYNPDAGAGAQWDGTLLVSRNCLFDVVVNIPTISTAGMAYAIQLSRDVVAPGDRDQFWIIYRKDTSPNWYYNVEKDGVAIGLVDTGVAVVAGMNFLRLKTLSGDRLLGYTSTDGEDWEEMFNYTTTANFPDNGMCAKVYAENEQAGAASLIDIHHIRTIQDFA